MVTELGDQTKSPRARMEARAEARQIIQQAIAQFPNHPTLYIMYGHMERRARQYQIAENIFRQGLKFAPKDIQLRWGLAQSLVQIGTEDSLKQAGEIFNALDKEGKLNKDDRIYHRFKTLARNIRANLAYDFFKSAGMRMGIAGRRDLDWYIADIIIEINLPEFRESFGMSGAFLVRCFQRSPAQIDILNLSNFLRGLDSETPLGLQDGRSVVINPSLAFIAVPNTNHVRDQIMNILGEKNEAIVPLDDQDFNHSQNTLDKLRDKVEEYLGQRNLYDSTMPVSGRRFFGREKLLLQLTEGVRHGQFMGIYGLRKMGKTSLMYQLRDKKLSSDVVAYLDLQSSAALTLKDCTPIYWELERDLYLRLREKNNPLAKKLRLGVIDHFSSLPFDSTRIGILFAEDMRSLLDDLSSRKNTDIQRVVIVMDELERILPVAGQSGINGYMEFFALLRGLAQTERYRGLISSVVVAANAAISERGYWEGRENPVFALYRPIPLPPLSVKECKEMIQTLGKGMSVYWSDDAVQAVFDETGGHPFFARQLCSRITEHYTDRPLTVTSEIVGEQTSIFIREDGDKLEQVTELLHRNFPDEEKVLYQIALGEVSKEWDDNVLRHLLGYHIITNENNSYRVNINLLRRWILRRAGIKQ